MDVNAEVSGKYTQIDVNSSVASGLSALLFDILLLMIIKTLSQTLCSTTNIYLVYDRRRSISPTISRLGTIAGGPAGPLRLSRILSILILISTACVIVLGFCINGKTIYTYETKKFRTVFRVTEVPTPFALDNEFVLLKSDSDSGGKEVNVSKWLVAVADSYICLENNYSHARVFAYGFRNDDLNGEMVNSRSRVGGGECFKQPSFKEALISREYPLGSSSGPPVRCSVTNLVPQFEDGNRQGKASYDVDKSQCDFELRDMFCYEAMRKSCAVMGRKETEDGDYNQYVVLIADAAIGDYPDPAIVHVPRARNEEEESIIARNVAFFRAVDVGGDQVSNLANMAITEIFRDVELEVKKGEVEISEVDLGLAIPVVLVIGATTVILLGTAFILWFRVVYSKGRRHYNTFSTLPEVLQLANAERREKLRRSRKELPCIGIGKHAPRIVVKSPEHSVECVGSNWAEGDIDGEGWISEVEAFAQVVTDEVEQEKKVSPKGFQFHGVC